MKTSDSSGGGMLGLLDIGVDDEFAIDGKRVLAIFFKSSRVDSVRYRLIALLVFAASSM